MFQVDWKALTPQLVNLELDDKVETAGVRYSEFLDNLGKLVQASEDTAGVAVAVSDAIYGSESRTLVLSTFKHFLCSQQPARNGMYFHVS